MQADKDKKKKAAPKRASKPDSRLAALQRDYATETRMTRGGTSDTYSFRAPESWPENAARESAIHPQSTARYYRQRHPESEARVELAQKQISQFQRRFRRNPSDKDLGS